MSSSKSAPASTWASSRKGVAPCASISRAICLATHVSRPQWLTKTNRFVGFEDSSATPSIVPTAISIAFRPVGSGCLNVWAIPAYQPPLTLPNGRGSGLGTAITCPSPASFQFRHVFPDAPITPRGEPRWHRALPRGPPAPTRRAPPPAGRAPPSPRTWTDR